MKRKHLFSLLDQSFTTIGVVYDAAPPIAAPAPPSGATLRERHPSPAQMPWQLEDEPRQQTWTFKIPKDSNVAVDDSVVVVGRTGQLEIVKVARVDPEPVLDIDADFDYKWVVQRVDMAPYEAQQKRETEFNAQLLLVDRAKQRAAAMDDFREHLPEGSEARTLFDTAVGKLNAPVIEATAS